MKKLIEAVKTLLASGIIGGLGYISTNAHIREATFEELMPLLIVLMFIAFWFIEELGGK